jgi:hypothetical protein
VRRQSATLRALIKLLLRQTRQNASHAMNDVIGGHTDEKSIAEQMEE